MVRQILHTEYENWFQVTAGEVLCDIETDKATLDLECMEDGLVLLKLFVIFDDYYFYVQRGLISALRWRSQHLYYPNTL
jgi:hypothetical protein